MNPLHEIEDIVAELGHVLDVERPNCDITSRLASMATALLDQARHVARRSRTISEHNTYLRHMVQVLSDDNEDVVQNVAWALNTLRSGGPDATVDAIDVLRRVFTVRDHAVVELEVFFDEDAAVEDEPPAKLRIKASLSDEDELDGELL